MLTPPTIQERRASARRGSGIAPATASVSCRTWMLACHGGLTPPALVLPCECLPTKKRFLRWTNACSQERRALARRGSVNRTLPRENRTLCSGYRTPIQERRALARRGSVTLCNGVDSPRLAYASRSWCTNGRLMQHTLVAIWTRTFAGAAGVSPPWFGNETGLQCTPNHVRPLTTNRTKSGGRQPAVVRERICNGERVLPNVMLACHGGLTPPALVLPCECRHGWLTPAALGGRLSSGRKTPLHLLCGNEHPRGRRASARRGSMTHLQWPAFFAEPKRPRRTAGSRQPLLVGSASAARSMRIPSAGSIRFPGWLTLVSPKKEPRAPGAER
jgi:hypothetical protein